MKCDDNDLLMKSFWRFFRSRNRILRSTPKLGAANIRICTVYIKTEETPQIVIYERMFRIVSLYRELGVPGP